MKRIWGALLPLFLALGFVSFTSTAAQAASQSGVPFYYSKMLTSVPQTSFSYAIPSWDRNSNSWLMADPDNNRIVVFDSNGNFVRTFGDSALVYPFSAVSSTAGIYYVSDSVSIKAFDSKGALLASDVVDGTRNLNSMISGSFLSADSLGHVFAAWLHSIYTLNVGSGKITGSFQFESPNTGAGIAVSSDGQVVVTSGASQQYGDSSLVYVRGANGWQMQKVFRGSDFGSWSNEIIEDQDGSYSLTVLKLDRTKTVTYDALTGELLSQKALVLPTGYSFAKNYSSYLPLIAKQLLASSSKVWVEAKPGNLQLLDTVTQVAVPFGVRAPNEVREAGYTAVDSDGTIWVLDKFGSISVFSSQFEILKVIELSDLPALATSLNFTNDGKLLVTFDDYTSATYDRQGSLVETFSKVRGLVGYTPTEVGFVANTQHAYPVPCQILSKTGSHYIYFGKQYGNTAVDESCSVRDSITVSLVENYGGVNETRTDVSLQLPDTSRAFGLGNLAISPNGIIIATINGGVIWVFNSAGLYLGEIPTPHFTNANVLGVVNFDANGNLLLGYGTGIAIFKPFQIFSSTPKPLLQGKPATGSTLTANIGAWDSAASLSFQWLRDGADILMATGLSYALTSDDYGHSISFRVVGEAVGYSTATQVSASKLVGLGAFTLSSTPTVTGNYSTGSTLQAEAGAWDSSARLTYQWMRDGIPIDGANSVNFQTTSNDYGHELAVQVTGDAPGYLKVSKVSTSQTIQMGTIHSEVPTITGLATVGSTVYASAAGWSSDASFDYQWLIDGEPVAGATLDSYLISSSDFGKQLSVRVTGSGSGYLSVTKVSDAFVVAKGAIVSVSPTISGTVSVGYEALATPGLWSAPHLEYQWLRDGAPIQNAIANKYTLVGADYGHMLSVSVTGSAEGYISTTRTSQETKVTLNANSQGLQLSGLNLEGQDLTFYNFKDADLSNSNLKAANLSYVNFRGAKLTNCRLVSANFAYADFTQANLSDADLTNGNAALSIFTGVNLTNANISGLKLDGKDFTDVNLTGVKGLLQTAPSTLPTDWASVANLLVGPTANLAGADLSRQSLKGLNLAGADLSNANLAGADLTGTNLQGAKLSGASFRPNPKSKIQISGVPGVGSELSVATGDWAKGLTYVYQWYLGGLVVAGASAPTYVLRSADVGKQVSLTVTASYLGTTLGNATAQSVLVVKGTMKTASPSVSGTAKVGATVTAKYAVWAIGAKVSFQWLLDGKPIKSATSKTLKVSSGQKNHKLSIKVTQILAGYVDASATSAVVLVK